MTTIRVWVEGVGRSGLYAEDEVEVPEGWADMTPAERDAHCREIYAALLAEHIGGGYEVIEPAPPEERDADVAL